jgi:uncharacterized protein YdeI (YjbR/CyaY-like superfamily)
MKPSYFRSPDEFRSWLAENHAKCTALLVGFYKKDSGKASITYPEALDEALCFGWIDRVRKSVDELSYTVRFTPRKKDCYWSKVNTKRAKELSKLGFMQPAGLKAFAARDRAATRRYSFERANGKLPPAYAKQFQATPEAWAFFQSQAPYYQRVATWWVVSAKQEETRLRRLQTLVEHCPQHRRVAQITSPNKG